MRIKEEFIQIYRENIKREGADKLLDYLKSTDFFEAPASTRYHSCYDGGLCDHSINVYYRLKKLVEAEDSMYNAYSDETIAIIGLLHDICKTNFYVKGYRKVQENGIWVTKPSYNIDEVFPYGHGEKSVYLINKFMKLSDVEALAIDWHMGPYDTRVKGSTPQAFEAAIKVDPIVFLTHIADSMATYLDESENGNED